MRSPRWMRALLAWSVMCGCAVLTLASPAEAVTAPAGTFAQLSVGHNAACGIRTDPTLVRTCATRRASGAHGPFVLAVAPSRAAGGVPVFGARTTPGVTRCPGTMSVSAGAGFGPQTVRLRLVGTVSCAQARRLVRAWYHRVATGGCGKTNNFCVLDMPGGWVCSFFSAGESPLAGGANAGCARGSRRIRIYVTRPTN